jgi:hypothetical protein
MSLVRKIARELSEYVICRTILVIDGFIIVINRFLRRLDGKFLWRIF